MQPAGAALRKCGEERSYGGSSTDFCPSGKKQAAARGEKNMLREGLAQTRIQLNQAYLCFNSADDPDLIESYVFEINALQARYNYLLRRVKELEEAL